VTDDERVRAVFYLRETKALVLDEAARLSPAQWRFKPAPDSWSPCECIEHVTLVEGNLLRMVQALANTPEPSAEVLAEVAGRDDQLVRIIRSRKRRAQAPAAALPASESPDPAEVVARFSKARDRSIDYMETTSDPIRARVHPHFVLGPFDGYQWILFLCAHAERHLRQIEEVKEHPDFPQ
jgi:hypothetical protein